MTDEEFLENPVDAHVAERRVASDRLPLDLGEAPDDGPEPIGTTLYLHEVPVGCHRSTPLDGGDAGGVRLHAPERHGLTPTRQNGLEFSEPVLADLAQMRPHLRGVPTLTTRR